MVYCQSCGAVNTKDDAYCFACHQSLTDDAPTPPSGAPAAHRVIADAPTSITGPSGKRYRILEQVGTGGFGAVYKAATSERGHRPVAIKEINLEGLQPQEIIEATDTFNREVQVLSSLRHPNLPRIYEHFTDPRHWYLVMEFIEGHTLETYLQMTKGRLTLAEVLDIGIQLCSVLEYLHIHHPPIIFRDLKPANVMLTPYQRVYLIDFGTARFFKPGQARDTIAFGSPGYAAPEQYGKAQTAPSADIYSLGATLHTLLTGKDPAESPFRFESLRHSNPALPGELDDLVMKMVALKASERPQSATEVRAELQRLSSEHMRRLYPYAPDSASRRAAHTYYAPSPNAGPYASSSSQGSQQAQMQVGRSSSARIRGRVTRRAVVTGMLLLAVVGPGALRAITHPVSPAATLPPTPHDLEIGVTLNTHRGQVKRVSSVAWSPRSQYVVSGSWDHTVQTWKAVTDEDIQTYSGHKGKVNAVIWSPDGSAIASASDDKTVQVCNTANALKLQLTYRGHRGAVTAIAWSPDGQYIASGSADTTVQVWSPMTGKCITTYRKHRGSITGLAWLPMMNASPSDPRYLVTGSQDGTVRLWDAYSGKDFLIYKKEGPETVSALACSPDGTFIAAAYNVQATSGNFYKLRIWNVQTGAYLKSYTNHTGEITAIAWSPESHSIATASEDGTVVVRDIDDESFATYQKHRGPVRSVAWSPDGMMIVSSGDDATAQVWEID